MLRCLTILIGKILVYSTTLTFEFRRQSNVNTSLLQIRSLITNLVVFSRSLLQKQLSLFLYVSVLTEHFLFQLLFWDVGV